ncbi:MAG: XRE family transcriptional regulator [Pseudomonadota bacterium]
MGKFSPVVEVEPKHGVGGDIRALRKSRGVTLSDMAETIERSVGWLSQVERGQTEPSIPDLRRIAQMFEVPTSFFFRNDLADESERGFVVRAAHRASLGSRRDGLTEELLSPHLSGDFEMILSTFEPQSKSAWIAARPTQEGGYLVRGSLTLQIGERRMHLSAGDSFQFENETYRWENATDEEAVALWVIAPPIY